MDVLQQAVPTPGDDTIAAGARSSAIDNGNSAQLSGLSVLDVVQTPPAFAVPGGACDCHVHVFGADCNFPFAPDRHYTPGVAPVAALQALQRILGMERVVVVQPSPYGSDNACTMAAVARLGRNARAVVVADERASEVELRRLQAAGARGLRVNLRTGGTVDVSLARRKLQAAAMLAAPHGWHIECFTDLLVVNALQTVIRDLPVSIVFDHFAGAPAAAGPGNPSLRPLLSLVADGKAYVKLSAPQRISSLPDCTDAAGVARALIAANPCRILWGSDWPHPEKPDAPRDPSAIDPFRAVDDGRALTRLADWAGDRDILHRILVANPARLYGFPPVA